MEEIKLNENYEKFPDNFFVPKEVKYGDHSFRNFLVRFDNLYEIYRYLNSKPVINKNIWTRESDLASITGNYKQAGIPYEKALEDLKNFDEEGYDEFADLVSELSHLKAGYKHEYETHRTLYGGYLNIPAYSAGDPLCYEVQRRIKKPKFINVYAALSYPWFTTKNQVLHRAVIMMSIIHALEKNGYNVNFETFQLSEKEHELVYMAINIQQYGERTNLQTLYKTNCHVEFFRRLLFRVLETMPVTDDWSDGYGHTCDAPMVKEILKIGDDALYFGTPTELRIRGDNLESDFKNCLEVLDLQNRFDVREITDEMQQKVKSIIK